MKKLFWILLLVGSSFGAAVTDTLIAQHQVTIPARVDRPHVKYNPLYYIQATDTIEVLIIKNGVTIKEYKYTPSIMPAAGRGLLFSAKLDIVETARTDIEE